MASRKNVKCIVQVSQIGLREEKNKYSRKRQRKKRRKKTDRENMVKYNWRYEKKPSA